MTYGIGYCFQCRNYQRMVFYTARAGVCLTCHPAAAKSEPEPEDDWSELTQKKAVKSVSKEPEKRKKSS